jgi:hypothetical protein
MIFVCHYNCCQYTQLLKSISLLGQCRDHNITVLVTASTVRQKLQCMTMPSLRAGAGTFISLLWCNRRSDVIDPELCALC